MSVDVRTEKLLAGYHWLEVKVMNRQPEPMNLVHMSCTQHAAAPYAEKGTGSLLEIVRGRTGQMFRTR